MPWHSLLTSAEPFRMVRRIILFPGFIDEERCAHFIKLAKARLAPSALALRKTEEDQETE